MKKAYDIILYFGWVHPSHIHKYLSLKKELNKRASCLLVLGNNKCGDGSNYGVSNKQLKPFDRFLDDVIIADLNQTSQILHEYKPKILVFGSDQHAWHWQKQISSQLNATTIQLTHLMGSEIFTNANPDYIAVFGPTHEAFLQNCVKVRPLVANQDFCSGVPRIYVNPWLYGLHEDCLPTELSKEDFCKKYKLDINKEIPLHCPSWATVRSAVSAAQNNKLKELALTQTSEDKKKAPMWNDKSRMLHEDVLNVHKEIYGLDIVITQLHPNEHKRYKSNRIGNKWSYEIMCPTASIIDPIESHWAYKYCDYGIGHVSLIGLEFGFFNKPFVYIGKSAASHTHVDWEWDGIKHYSWVGHECPLDEMKDFLANKNYRIENEDLYKKHQEKFSTNPNVNSIEFLAEKISSVDIISK